MPQLDDVWSDRQSMASLYQEFQMSRQEVFLTYTDHLVVAIRISDGVALALLLFGVATGFALDL